MGAIGTDCRCCGATLTRESLYCDDCQSAWDQSTERHQANRLGLYGQERQASFKAFEERRRAELGESISAMMGGAS